MTRKADTACLLLHGFGSTTFELEPLAEVLRQDGYTVHLEHLPGHTGDIQAFRKTFFRDWLQAAEDRYHMLAATHQRVVPVGFSMGASLALFLAAKFDPVGAVCLAPGYPRRLWPLRRQTFLMMLLPVLQHLKPQLVLPPLNPESRAIAPYEGIEGYLCLPQVNSLLRGLTKLPGLLPDILCPLLLMYDARDRTCLAEDGIAIARRVSSENVTFHLTRMRENITSHHMLPTHRETKQIVIDEVKSFLEGLENTTPRPVS